MGTAGKTNIIWKHLINQLHTHTHTQQQRFVSWGLVKVRECTSCDDDWELASPKFLLGMLLNEFLSTNIMVESSAATATDVLVFGETVKKK